jgi:hypothetical protein
MRAVSDASRRYLEENLTAIRRARAVVAVSEIQRRSVQRGTYAITLAEIDAEIAAVRRDCRIAGRATGEVEE